MWKKDEAVPTFPPSPDREERPRRPEAPPSESRPGERATIGRSITIVGEVKGDEDLLIQGRVEGSVDLKDQSVTVGRDGRVKANVTARVVAVEGDVEGDLRAEEQVILRSSASVQGDIVAPRVILEDGARFRGLVDMGDPAKPEKSAAQGSGLQGKKSVDSPKTAPSMDSSKALSDSTKVGVDAGKAGVETAEKAAS